MKSDAAAPGVTGAEGVQWNLSDLVGAPVDQHIDDALAEADRRLQAFSARYRGRVSSLGPVLWRRLR